MKLFMSYDKEKEDNKSQISVALLGCNKSQLYPKTLQTWLRLSTIKQP